MSSAPTDPPALRRIWIRTGQKKQPFSGDGIITASSLPIKLRRYTRTCRRCRRMDGSESETWTEPTTVGTEIVVINFGLAKEESLYREKEYVPMLNQCLDNIGVPRSVQPSVVGEIFGLVDQATTVPMVLVDVLIRDVTELWVGDDDAAIADHEWSVLNRAIRESMAGDVYRAKLIPATKPSIQSLEKVRRCQVEAVVKETPNCVVCMDSLLDEQAEEEARRNNKRKRHDEEEEVTTRGAKKLIKLSKSCVEFFQKMVTVTRLPCLHHFHTDCIVPWLEINHTCPVCRNAISTQLENLN